MRYSLRQLEIFLAVAKTQSASLAAENLGMSQSAASAAIAQFELQCGVTLFNRTGKRLSLSSAGKAIRPRALALFDHALKFEQSLAGIENTGHLHVGASLTIGNYLAVNYFSQFMTRYPEIDASFQIGNSPEIVKKVLNFDVDIGLIEYEMSHTDLLLEKWRQDELVVFCSPKHPLAKKKELGVSDIKSAKWILREANSGTRQAFDRAMVGLLPELNVVLELEHNEAIKRAVEAQIGIGCLSEIALESNFKKGDLVPLRLKNRALRRYFYFVTHRQRERSAAVNRWMQICRETR